MYKLLITMIFILFGVVLAAADFGKTEGLNVEIVGKDAASTAEIVSQEWRDGVMSVKIKNSAQRESSLTIWIKAPLSLREDTKFWDGSDEYTVREGKIGRDKINDTFPLSCVWDGRNGIALGLHPESLLSWIASEADSSSMRFGVRMILKPGAVENVNFFAWNFNPKWGWRSAVDSYYLRFPESFRAHKGVDPRIHKGTEVGAYAYNPWYSPVSPSIFRRIRGTHGWCYGPFKISPDFYGRQQYWKPEGLADDKEKALSNTHCGSAATPEQLHAVRLKAFQKQIPANITNLFYMSNCSEMGLAEKLYPESILERKNFNWSHHEISWRMFPFGGLFGSRLETDIKDLCSELPMGGFAFDSSGGMGIRFYRGPVIWDLPVPPAFDDVGPYVMEGVGHALCIRFMHENGVQGGRFKAACKINPGGEYPLPYMLTFAADSGMIEWPFLRIFEPEKERLISRYRLFMGQKYINQHAGLGNDNYGEMIKWRDYSPEQMRLLYRARIEYDVLAGLLYGIMPFPTIFAGVPEVYGMLDMFDDLSALGWYASPGVRHGGDMSVARYGQGAHAAIVLCNMLGNKVSDNFKVMGEDFAVGSPLLFSYTGEEMEWISDDNSSNISLSLNPRCWKVVEIVGSRQGGGTFKALTSLERSRHELKLTLKNQSGNPVSSQWILPGLDGYSMPSVSVDGKSCAIDQDGGVFKFKQELPKEGKMVISYKSPIFLSPDAKVAELPIMTDGKVTASIVLPPSAGEKAKLAAYWIAEFFEFYFKNGLSPSLDIKIPVLDYGAATTGTLFKLKLGEKPIVKLDGTSLEIIAPTEEDLAQLTWEALKIFENRYPLFDNFHVNSKFLRKGECKPETKKLLEYCGLWGTQLHLYQGPDLEEIKRGDAGRGQEKAKVDEILSFDFDDIKDVKAIDAYGAEGAFVLREERVKSSGTGSNRLKFKSKPGINGSAKLSIRLQKPVDLSAAAIEFMMMPVGDNCGIHGVELVDSSGKISEEHRYYLQPPKNQWSKRSFQMGASKIPDKGRWFRASGGDIKDTVCINIYVQSLEKGGDVEVLFDDLVVTKNSN